MAEVRSRVHIERLRLRVPARDAAAGKQAALEFVEGLAASSPELAGAAPRGATIGALAVRVPARGAPGEGGAASRATSALVRAVARAGRGS